MQTKELKMIQLCSEVENIYMIPQESFSTVIKYIQLIYVVEDHEREKFKFIE